MADEALILEMTALARTAAARAYAPYSKFKVGAVLRGRNGRLYSGCNVENAAYPEGNCAEASAIAAMVLDGETEIAEVLVIAEADAVVTPCGGCRQRLREFAPLDTPVHCMGGGGERLTRRLGDLLPHSFGREDLG